MNQLWNAKSYVIYTAMQGISVRENAMQDEKQKTNKSTLYTIQHHTQQDNHAFPSL